MFYLPAHPRSSVSSTNRLVFVHYWEMRSLGSSRGIQVQWLQLKSLSICCVTTQLGAEEGDWHCCFYTFHEEFQLVKW